jgi:hypothetical protein
LIAASLIMATTRDLPGVPNAVPIKGIAVPLRVVAIMAVGRMQADVKPFADGVGLAALFFRKHVTA